VLAKRRQPLGQYIIKTVLRKLIMSPVLYTYLRKVTLKQLSKYPLFITAAFANELKKQWGIRDKKKDFIKWS
jgi:hypothetical protein